MKGADRALRLMTKVPGIEWVAIPGNGFPDHYGETPATDRPTEYRTLEKTGLLPSEEVARLLATKLDGVLISSR